MWYSCGQLNIVLAIEHTIEHTSLGVIIMMIQYMDNTLNAQCLDLSPQEQESL